MKALEVNALGRGFDFEDIHISTPIGREVLVDVQASGLCHICVLLGVLFAQAQTRFLRPDTRGSD